MEAEGEIQGVGATDGGCGNGEIGGLKMKKKVVVTGGSGFVGKHLTKRLAQNEGYDVVSLSSSQYDLRRRDRVEAMFDELRPDIVVHLAAICGGIGANQKNPGKFFYDN